MMRRAYHTFIPLTRDGYVHETIVTKIFLSLDKTMNRVEYLCVIQ